ncbi:MAG: MipA/OmpV family protein, partial [Acidobacteriota bacterium]
PRPGRAAVAVAFSATLLVSAAPAWSDDAEPPGKRGGFFVAGVAEIPEFLGADDGQLVPFLVGQFEGRRTTLEIEGLEARLDMIEGTRWRGGPSLSLGLPRDDDFVDEPRVQLLPEVDFALELGAFVGLEMPWGRTHEDRLRVDLAVRRDVLDAHDGLLAKLEFDYFFKISRMQRLGVAAALTWADGDYHRAYFSISPEASELSDLAPFDASAGVRDVGLEIYGITSFSERWGAFLRVAWNRLLGDAADSPVVVEAGSEDQLFTGLGVFYRW